MFNEPEFFYVEQNSSAESMGCNYFWLRYSVKFNPKISPASKFIRYDQKTKSISATSIPDLNEVLIITANLTAYLSDGVSKSNSQMAIIFEPSIPSKSIVTEDQNSHEKTDQSFDNESFLSKIKVTPRFLEDP